MKKSLIFLACLALASCKTPAPTSSPTPAPAPPAAKLKLTVTVPVGPPALPALTLISQTLVPNVTLGWPQSTDPDVTSYNVYWRTNAGAYTGSTNVPGIASVTATIGPLSYATTYYFAATAKTATLESPYTPETAFTTEAVPVINTNVDFILQLQTSSTINGVFENVGAPVYMNSSDPKAFFRLQITTITN